jgi:hypothetical protein
MTRVAMTRIVLSRIHFDKRDEALASMRSLKGIPGMKLRADYWLTVSMHGWPEYRDEQDVWLSELTPT